MKKLIFLVVVVVFLAGCSKAEENCKAICSSHGYSYLKCSYGGYENTVCYCKDVNGALWTFVM